MDSRFYFDTPKQVVFADPENPGEWLNGIAFRDVIICSCCGGVFEISEVVNLAAEDGVINPIYAYHDWNDMTDSVVGGTLPEGLDSGFDANDEYKVFEVAAVDPVDGEVADEEATEYEAYAYKLESETVEA